MWLGLEKLGLAKLNIKSSSDIYEKVIFLENLNSLISLGKDVQENLYFYEKVELNHLPLSIGIIENFSIRENLNKNISGKINFYDNVEFSENLNQFINLSTNINENLDFFENINKNILNSKNINEILKFKDEILSEKINLSENIIEQQLSFQEYLNSEITGSNLDINEMKFNSAIPAHKTLYINSNTYSVLLDNQNIIDKYSGEWIFISPETIKINIQPKNSNLEIWIEYQELFL